MFSPLVEKVLLATVGLLMAAGVAFALYAGVEHNKVQAGQIAALSLAASQAEANAATAASEASATRAAFAAQATALQAAQKTHAAATTRLASAVSANPSAAAAIVAADVWDAIDGGEDAP
jgi:hypothetical protein